MRVTRALIALATAAAITLSLAGCDVLAPTRNSDGTIVTATEMPSTDAWVGDCFSFIEGSNLSYATVVPCADTHTYVVIAKGTLSETKLSLYESLQIAVITVCQRPFDAYVTAQGTDPSPEYIVSTVTKPGGEVTNYSCLATDSAE